MDNIKKILYYNILSDTLCLSVLVAKALKIFSYQLLSDTLCLSVLVAKDLMALSFQNIQMKS
jgi:hypothetical protein